MALGFIDFLLGGKKGNKPQKNAQPAQPVAQAQQGADSAKPQEGEKKGADQAKAQEGGDKPQFQDANKEGGEKKEGAPQGADQGSQGTSPAGKTKVTDVINGISEQLKETNEKLTGLVTDLKSMENNVSTLTRRVDDIEESKKSVDEKLSEMDTNMTKFLSLYEMVNNQFNPFIDHSGAAPESKKIEPPMITIDAQGSTMTPEEEKKPEENAEQPASEAVGENPQEEKKEEPTPIGQGAPEPQKPQQQAPPQMPFETKQAAAAFNEAINYEMSLLELDTLDIEEAAGAAVPLTHLRNNTNSLVTILSWLEYLIKRVGIEGTRDGLRYYTEILRWITPEVFFDLDKYLKGMKERNHDPTLSLSVKDHIVSLYFISKLNDKALDEKLTKAVLQIIKH